MFIMLRQKINFLLVASVVCLSSCDGIYDDPSQRIVDDESANKFSYVDATAYEKWVYIDFESHHTVTLLCDDTVGIPDKWDMALHRYDVKTNDGKTLETRYEQIDSLLADIAGSKYVLPETAAMVADVADSVTVDMSTMMTDGLIKRTASMVNKEIGKWLNVNTSTMPPVYTPSNKVYLLRLADGRYVAVRFTEFANPNMHNIKGYISFEFRYIDNN